MLDLVNSNPWTRLPTSEYKSLSGVREWLSKQIKNNIKSKNNAAAKKKIHIGKSIIRFVKMCKHNIQKRTSRCGKQLWRRLKNNYLLRNTKGYFIFCSPPQFYDVASEIVVSHYYLRIFTQTFSLPCLIKLLSRRILSSLRNTFNRKSMVIRGYPCHCDR